MNRILIIGCGDVVRRALPQLTRSYRVYALVRTHDAALTAAGVTQIVGDLDQPATLKRLRSLAHLVLYTAPPLDQDIHDPRMQQFLKVLRQGNSLPRRIVYISTSGVYGDYEGRRVSESMPSAPRTQRGQRRVAAEKMLRNVGRNTDCRVSILRAPGIYAADRLPLERLKRGNPVLHAEEDVYTNHIHAEDLARACLLALRRGGANRAYNVSDDSSLLMGDWYDLLADSHDLHRPPRVSRAEAIEHVSPTVLSFMNESRQLDNSRIKRELGFRFHYPTVHSALPTPKKKPKPRLRRKAVATEKQIDLF